MKFLSHPNALEFDVKAPAILRGCGVYIYIHEDRAVYVGSSSHTVGRCLSRGHHRREELLLGTSLIILPCKDVEAARELEDWLILELRPICNRRGGWAELARLMGFSSQNSIAQVYKEIRESAA